jgi:uncharacterized membrane protein
MNMNISDAHWHMLLNHFPIILSITATGLLILALFIRNKVFANTALFLLVLGGISSIPAFQTGEMAEEVIEAYPEVSEATIERHEDAAATGYTIILISGAIALVALLIGRKKKEYQMLPVVIGLVAGLTASGFMTWVGSTGGKIRHPELAQQTANSIPGNNTQDTPLYGGEEDDDD